MHLAIIVLNYKTPHFTIDCLQALSNEVNEKTMRVVVVDNGSKDESEASIGKAILQNKWDNWCELVASKENRGFSAGNNIGIRSIEADYYLLLNNDTIVRRNALTEMLAAFQEDKAIGLVGPQLEWPDEKIQVSTFHYHTILSELIRGADTGLITQLFPSFNVPIHTVLSNTKIEWVSFACVMIKAEVIRNVGLLDEGFFLYFEDTEYCHRALSAGWKIKYAPKARVIHLKGGSAELKTSQRLRKKLPAYYYESRARYFKLYYRNIAILGLTLANASWSAGKIISFFRENFGNKISSACENEFIDTWSTWRTKQKW